MNEIGMEKARRWNRKIGCKKSGIGDFFPTLLLAKLFKLKHFCGTAIIFSRCYRGRKVE